MMELFNVFSFLTPYRGLIFYMARAYAYSRCNDKRQRGIPGHNNADDGCIHTSPWGEDECYGPPHDRHESPLSCTVATNAICGGKNTFQTYGVTLCSSGRYVLVC